MVQCAVVTGDSGLVGIYQYTQLENILILRIFTECLPGANSVLDTMDTSMQSHGFVLSWGRQTTNRYRAPLVVKREIRRAGTRNTRDPHVPSGTCSTVDPTYGKGEFQEVHSQVTQTSIGFSYSLTPRQVPVERLMWTVRQKKSKFSSQA